MMSDEVDLVATLPENTPQTDQLQSQIKTSLIPSNGDGICNAWRTSYICDVFDVQDVNLNQVFPFTAMTTAKDKEKVRASIHLAKLQFQFNESCRYYEIVDEADADYHAAYLHHMIRLMAHNLSYLERDKPTPPIGFH
jgi:hypothetical protein